MVKNCTINSLVFASLVLLGAADAWAIVVPPTTIAGASGNVIIGERQIDAHSVDYYVDVLGSIELHALAISNGGFGSGPPYSATASLGSWSAVVLSPTQWDDGFAFSIGLGGANAIVVNTLSLGSYGSRFGSDPFVSLFYRKFHAGAPVVESNDQDQPWTNPSAYFHLFDGESNSEFIALGGSGEVIDASFSASAVPEASAGFLLPLVGGIGIAAAGLRKRLTALAV